MTQSNGVKSLDLANAQLPAVQAAEAKLLLQTYERNPILFVGGEGVHLIDEQGNRYLDLLSGIGVNALGYGHPAIVDAIAPNARGYAVQVTVRTKISQTWLASQTGAIESCAWSRTRSPCGPASSCQKPAPKSAPPSTTYSVSPIRMNSIGMS